MATEYAAAAFGGLMVHRARPASDVAIDELNADGRWDLMIAGSEGVSIVLPGNNENMADSATNPVIETAGAGSALHRADLDNDGRSDFLVAGAVGLKILRGKETALSKTCLHYCRRTRQQKSVATFGLR